MSKRVSIAASAAAKMGVIEPELLEILGPPPLLIGESEEEYRGLVDRVRAAIAPADIIEELWVRDVVDNSWQIRRLRRQMAKLMDARRRGGLEKALEDLGVPFTERQRIAVGWISGDSFEKAEVKRLFKSAGQDTGTIEANALALRLDDFERIDHMITQVEARRNVVIREIDRRRDLVARRLRDAISDIEDAEFEDTPRVAAEGVAIEAAIRDNKAAE